MSNRIKTIKKARKQAMTRINDIQMRKHLNADALLETMRAMASHALMTTDLVL